MYSIKFRRSSLGHGPVLNFRLLDLIHFACNFENLGAVSCTWNDIGGRYLNQKHSRMPFHTLSNRLPLFSICFNRFYAFLKDFIIFNPLKFLADTRSLVTPSLVTRYCVTLFSKTRSFI